MKRTIQFGMAAMLLLALVCAAPSATSAASEGEQGRGKESQLRTLRGSVTDKDENPVRDGAIVYLKNTKTGVVKTYIAEDTGEYRFTGLDPNVDYEVHAEHKELASAKRNISSFDSRKEIVVHLKLNKKRE